jgi:hypothetical protein
MYAVVQGNHDSENRAVYRENSKKDEDYQKWNIVYSDSEEAKEDDDGYSKDWGMHINRPFHIVSEVGENRHIDLVSNRMVIKTHSNRNTQVFKFDWKTKTIKSKGYSTEWSHSIDMRNTWMYVYGTGSQWHQLFRYNSTTRQFYNQRGKVLDIKGNKDQEGEYVGTAGSDLKREQQRWVIRYVDKMNKTATTGIGMGNFEIGRPFYI